MDKVREPSPPGGGQGEGVDRASAGAGSASAKRPHPDPLPKGEGIEAGRIGNRGRPPAFRLHFSGMQAMRRSPDGRRLKLSPLRTPLPLGEGRVRVPTASPTAPP